MTICQKRRLFVVAVGVACILAPAPLAAQSPAGVSRPFRGIFGGSNPESRSSGGLDLTASLQQVHDDDVTGQTTRPGGGARQAVGGGSSRAGIALDYTRKTDTLTLAANARTNGAYFPALENLSGLTHSGAFSLSARKGRVGLAVAQTAAKSPFYSLALAPRISDDALAFPADPVRDAHVIRRDGIHYGTRVMVTHQLTLRTTLSATGGWRGVSYESDHDNLTHRSGSLQVTRKLTQYLAVQGGYNYQEARYSTTGAGYVSEDIMAGGNYDRPLSRTRRTFVSFTSGVSALQEERRPGRNFRVTASAGLRRLVGRTWTAAIQYDRGARYVEGFGAPFLSDGVTTTMSGFLSRRVDVSLTGAYSTGVIGFSASAPSYDHYFGIGTLRVALNRLMALQGEYLYYHYRLGLDPTATDLPVRFDRRGARVGLTFWLPLVR